MNGKPVTFYGKVDGNKIEAAAGPRGDKREWSAVKKG
jgi:hypothetical protein